MAFHPPHERVQMDIAPAAREGQLLVRRDHLVTEADHQVVQQRGPNIGELFVRQILRQVDPGDLRRHRTGDLVRFQVAIPRVAWRIHRVRPSICPGVCLSRGVFVQVEGCVCPGGYVSKGVFVQEDAPAHGM